MYREVFVKYVFALSLLVVGFSYGVACDPAPPENKEKTVDASTAKETKPEPTVVRETTPEGLSQPEGLGEACRISPHSAQGTCKNDRLLCGSVSTSSNICFENCSGSDKCSVPGEQCTVVKELSTYRVCVKVAQKGETCGLDKRIICPGKSADPPLFCIQGKCTEKPKDGWGVGQVCSPPRGDQQSDCKKGLVCIIHAKGLYQCAKSCKADGDCTNGEICWEEPLKAKVCVIPVKAGGKCNKLERKFCKSDNPLSPLNCKEGICKSDSQLKQLGEKCTKSTVPGQERGNCDQNMVCLGVSRLEAKCHKACKAKSDCPSSESCVAHPNVGPGDPIQACVIEVAAGGECDLTARKMCAQEANKFFKCKKPDDKTTKGVCTEIKIGDGCKVDTDCGRMVCTKIDPKNPANKYCLLPCDPKAPKCPANGACRAWEQNGPTTCVPTGPKQKDEACTQPQATGPKLNTTTFCTGGLNCIALQQGAASGICMKNVAQCAAGSCSAGHVCIAVRGGGLCGLDCSKDKTVCKPGTKCTPIKVGQANYTICGATK